MIDSYAAAECNYVYKGEAHIELGAPCKIDAINEREEIDRHVSIIQEEGAALSAGRAFWCTAAAAVACAGENCSILLVQI